MKLILLFLSFILLSCEDLKINGKRVNLDNYTLHSKKIVPDSLKNKQAEFVKETVRAASFHMTGGDYEDPEDVIKEANYTFIDIYGIKTKGLQYNYDFIPIDSFTNTELQIYNLLKNK